MKTITINEIEFNNFGKNNYSCGMELITLYPCPKDLVQRVLNKEFEGVYLNPSVPCGSEFFGVLGTDEQYKEFYSRQRNAIIGEKIVDKFGFGQVDRIEWEEYKRELENSYKDWWE
jgi:hypothetical protein